MACWLVVSTFCPPPRVYRSQYHDNRYKRISTDPGGGSSGATMPLCLSEGYSEADMAGLYGPNSGDWLPGTSSKSLGDDVDVVSRQDMLED